MNQRTTLKLSITSYSYSNSDNTLTAKYVPNTPADSTADAPKVVVEPTSRGIH